MLTFLKGFFGNAVIPAFKEVEEGLVKEVVNIPEQLKILETKPIIPEAIEKIEMPDIDPELKQIVETQIGDFAKLQETTINSYNADTKFINDVVNLMSKKTDNSVINNLIKDGILQVDEETNFYTIIYNKTNISTDTWTKLFNISILKDKTVSDTFKLSKDVISSAYTNYQLTMNKLYQMYIDTKIPIEDKEAIGNILVTLNKNKKFFGEQKEGKAIIKDATQLTDYRIPKLDNLKNYFYQTYQNLLTSEAILKTQSPILKKFIEASKKQIGSVKKITDITKKLAQSNETLTNNIKVLEGTKSDLSKKIIDLQKSGETQTLELNKATANLKTVTTQLDKTKLDLDTNKNLLNDMEKTRLSNESKLQELQQSILSSETKLSQTTEELEKTKLLNETKLQELQQSIKVSEQKLIEKAEELEQKTLQSQTTEKKLQQAILEGENLALKNKNIADTLEMYKNDFVRLEHDKGALEAKLFNTKREIETLEGRLTYNIELSEKEIEILEANIETLEANLKTKIKEQDSVKEKITNFLEGTKDFIMSQKLLTFGSVSSIVVAIGSVITLIVKEVTEHKDTKEAIVKRVYNKTGISKDLLEKLYDKALGIKAKDSKPKPKKINKVKPKKNNIKKK
jgi:hypothetical protein